MRVGLIGFGAIGRAIVELWERLPTDAFELAGACVRPAQLEVARGLLLPQTLVCDNVSALLAIRPDCIIEAAGHRAVASHGEEILRAGSSLYLLSVGSLADKSLRAALVQAAKKARSHIIIPSGALAGFDGLRTMECASLRSVKYTSAKPPKAWLETPAAKQYNLERLMQRTILFQGNASDAARLFPQNANLAAAVALAGIGFERTVIELVADPHINGNVGTLEAVSHSTELSVTVSSTPSSNPKTSANVGPSVIAALRNSAATLRFT
jgi:aspartate dehydrogenase